MRILPRFPRRSLLAHKTRRAVKARHHLLRRKFRVARKRAVLRIRLALLKLRNQAHLKWRSLLTFASKWIATAARLLLAVLFGSQGPSARKCTVRNENTGRATSAAQSTCQGSASRVGTTSALPRHAATLWMEPRLGARNASDATRFILWG